jgi:hypothetical protein
MRTRGQPSFAFGWNDPDPGVDVDLAPSRAKDFARTPRREDGKLQASAATW